MDSLSRDLVKSFAEVVNEPKQKEPVRYVRGTITGKGDAKYVQLDGSTVATPISEVVDAQEGDRVLVSIENHRAVIVGNFTFSPSARQEQEALEKAEGAENTANSAGETANAAQLAAQEASKNANEAMGAASAASASAAEAKDQAADAMVAASNVEGLAQEAKENAIQANENATQAKTDAAAAQAAVANANEEIGKINDAIETAQGDIDQALDDLHSQAGEIEVIKRDYSTKVETENIKAELSTQITESVGQLQTTIQQNYYTKNDIVEIQGNLQSQITQNAEGLSSQATKIESLESDTAEAQKQVNQALEKANSAQQAATQAKQDAATANEAAEKAQNEAVTAAEKAQNANDAALDAKLAAHVADKALADAREALDQARENYKNVVSNPGSTAEDIANAAAQVETAKQAVETALEDAAEAQYVANKAQEAADVAQEEANAASQAAQTAQNKADAAEQAANNAQAAAEQAAEDVAALTKRVTTAETKIDQNAEQISLNATKTEEIGDKLVNDYYSKTETDALIKVESDRITSTVSKVETVEKTAITSTIEEFYLSSSPTSLSGGSWVTTQPTWTQGKYIWRRTKVTKGDGTTSYSPSQNGVCITGNTGDKGDTGATGATGNGISKTEVYYYLSTSNTTQSGGSWSTTVPAWIDGRYYWQKIKTTYTNGNSSESTPVCITGGKGATGATGNTGATGKGVSSITIEFYLSNSKTTQSGGSWTTTMPTWTSGKYLWTRNKIVYTNPASTVYTTPICDSSWEAVNEIEVGGRNFFLNSNFDKTMTNSGTAKNPNLYPQSWDSYNRGILNPTTSYHAHVDDKTFNFNVIEFNESDGSRNWKGIVQELGNRLKNITGNFTLSLDTNATLSGTRLYGGFYYTKKGGSSAGFHSEQFDIRGNDIGINSWKRASTIVKLNDDVDFNKSIRFYIYGYNFSSNAILYIDKVKLEKGNIATDWTPAPEDVEEDLSAVEKRVTSAEQKLTSTQWSLWFTEVVNNSVATSTKFTMDKNGLHIKGGGIDISNNAGTKVFYADTSGNLVIKNLTATNGTFSGTINATSGKIGGWKIANSYLNCSAHNDSLNVNFTTKIDATSGNIVFTSSNSEYTTEIGIDGIHFETGWSEGDRWVYRDVVYGLDGIESSGNIMGEYFSLNGHGVQFGPPETSVGWANNGGVLKALGSGELGNIKYINGFCIGGANRNQNKSVIPVIGSDGVMEVGRYIDFHPGTSPSDYSPRLSANTSGLLTTSGGFTAAGSLRSGGGNQYTSVTSSWIGFYRSSDAARVGWIGADGTNNMHFYAERGYIMLAVDTSGSGQIRLTDRDDQYGAFFSPVINGYICLGNSNNRFFGVYLSHSPNVSSDKRIKNNIIPISKGLKSRENIFEQLFDLLKPVSFSLSNDKSNKTHIGFVAQDVSNALSSLGVKEDNFELIDHMFFTDEETGEEKDEYGLRYEEFIALNTHMIQKANTTIQSQQKEIDDLKKQAQDLQELVFTLLENKSK